MTAATLRKAVERGDARAAMAVVLGASKGGRDALAPVAEALRASVGAERLRAACTNAERAAFLARREAARLAVLATAPRPEVLEWADGPEQLDASVRVLRTVRPPWLRGAAAELLRMNGTWRLARRLVHEGLSDPPDSWGELTQLFSHFGLWDRERPLAVQLADDPRLLEQELWELLQTEGSGPLSFAAHDKYSRGDRRWDVALVELARRGVVPRDRLLDASLEALERDFAQFRAGWFSAFHEQLAPTLEERAARAGRYAGLLQSSIPPTVSFALAALEALARAGRLPDDPDALRPALLARAKKTALAALKLLDRAGAPRLAVVALGHEAKEVQAAALAVIERHGEAKDEELAAAVRERAGDVAATLRARVAAWLGEPAPAAKTPRPVKRPAKRGRRPSVLDSDRAVTPITDVDELVDRAAALVEEPDDPDELERVLDGLSRLCAERPADLAERAGPLLKRARKRLEVWHDGAWDLARLVVGWVEGTLPKRHRHQLATCSGFHMARLDALGERVARGEARPLLSAPTHRGGFLAPAALVARVRAAGAAFDPPDAVLALLRLAPDGREAAVRQVAALRGELGLALRHALGATVRVGPTAALWIAAARARAPGEDDPAVERRHPGLGPGAGLAGRMTADVREHTWGTKQQSWSCRWLAITTTPAPPLTRQRGGRLRKTVPPLHPTVDLHPHTPPGSTEPFDARRVPLDLGVRWAFTLWPSWKEPLFAAGAAGGRLPWDEDNGPIYANYLEPLVDPTTPLGPMACLLLARGLGAKQAGDQGLAVDATIAALGDGRLDGERLGEALAITLPGAKPPRLARSLAEVGRAHGEATARAIVRGLRGEPPRDVGALLDLLHDLLVEHGLPLDDAEAAAFLGRVTGGKSAKTAKALLALRAPAPPPTAGAAGSRARRGPAPPRGGRSRR